MINTTCGRYVFTVKDGYPANNGYPAQAPRVMLECQENDLAILRGGFLQLYLRDGLNEARARELALLLNECVGAVGYTPR